LNRKLSALLVFCSIVVCFIPSASAQVSGDWNISGDWGPTLFPTPTPFRASDQVINNEYSMMPMLTLLIIVVIGGLVLTAFRGNLDGPQLITGLVIVVLIGLGAAVAVSILAGIQTVTHTWGLLLFFTK
jgi:hypothetical protein